ncbi:MAG: ornithine cyclodeaminase [bacterium]
MMKIITEEAIAEIVKRHGFDNFLRDLIEILKTDYCNWEKFTKMPRPAMHVPGGVLELMPICDNQEFYTFKYVNCHPKNIQKNLQTVVATGQLSEIKTGYPLMFSEMTVLTAIRTAANAALATDIMARKNAHVWALIGTGAQSEFQTKAMLLIRDIKEIRFFDIDAKAMDKYQENITTLGIKLVRCHDAEEAVKGADIITTCTACKANVDVIKNSWVREGAHINALGGDTIGKTELELSILDRSRIVVEYFEQAFIEGEIQRLSKTKAKEIAKRELCQLLQGTESGRTNDQEITLFDSVGIALEDYSVLKLTYDLANKYGIGLELNLTPVLADPKDLFFLVK